MPPSYEAVVLCSIYGASELFFVALNWNKYGNPFFPLTIILPLMRTHTHTHAHTHTHVDVIPTDNVEVAFRDVDVAILVGAMPRREGMERKDLLRANARIFESQGRALDQFAKKTVKVR